MWMCSRWMKPFSSCLNRNAGRSLAAGLLVAMGVAGCSPFPFGSASPPKAALMEDLQSEPTACAAYRQAYVEGFEAHVEGLSAKQDARKQEGIKGLNMSQELLARNGLDKDDCSRPLCIIEPLQGGKLDSWCGYRVMKTDGPELYQWFEWSTVQP